MDFVECRILFPLLIMKTRVFRHIFKLMEDHLLLFCGSMTMSVLLAFFQFCSFWKFSFLFIISCCFLKTHVHTVFGNLTYSKIDWCTGWQKKVCHVLKVYYFLLAFKSCFLLCPLGARMDIFFLLSFSKLSMHSCIWQKTVLFIS